LKKKLQDFSIDELIKRATGAFGEQDTEGHAGFEDERHALYAVLNFKSAEQQAKLNENVEKLTRKLVWLTWALVVLTAVMLIKMFEAK
jgi:hypothetical protein